MKTEIIMGKENGKNYKIDLKEYSNILITGVDDYSKSDLINNILYQLISNNNRDDVKILPIDVKGVDYKLYDSSSHFMSPIIKEAKYCKEVFEGLVKEIEEREKKESDSYPLIIMLIAEFDDLMIDTGLDVLPSLEDILKRGSKVGVYTILSTLYLDNEEYGDYVYKYFNLTASFFDRSKSKFNKFKFIKANDNSFNLVSNNKNINCKLKNIIIPKDKIEKMLMYDK